MPREYVVDELYLEKDSIHRIKCTWYKTICVRNPPYPEEWHFSWKVILISMKKQESNFSRKTLLIKNVLSYLFHIRKKDKYENWLFWRTLE